MNQKSNMKNHKIKNQSKQTKTHNRNQDSKIKNLQSRIKTPYWKKQIHNPWIENQGFQMENHKSRIKNKKPRFENQDSKIKSESSLIKMPESKIYIQKWRNRNVRPNKSIMKNQASNNKYKIQKRKTRTEHFHFRTIIGGSRLLNLRRGLKKHFFKIGFMQTSAYHFFSKFVQTNSLKNRLS